jgi:asparagine synthase (glutamine-hydrolysing)
MCGISGLYNFNNENISIEVIERMNNSLSHRGPDAGDVKVFGNVALGHRRLSIIDLSSKANQPMSTEDERYYIVYNGEVYNFLELREELKEIGVEFRTNSDTEVILKAFVIYGYDCFNKFNGMFAITIYDNETKQMHLARDRFGIKPLYYFQDDFKFAFGSEIKAIKALGDIDLTISKQAFTEYLWYGNPLGENTIYDRIHEVKPGTVITVEPGENKVYQFFDIHKIEQSKLTESEIVEKIKVLFEESVKRHLVSDVPVGVFLSGGIDSSAITAFASKHYEGKLKTYSVSFDYDLVNELPLARKVAKQFDTDHQEVHISGGEVIDVIEALVKSHDEPFGDAADIPLYMLTQKLKGKVKVVLQGDGGDEFFGGYSRYRTIQQAGKWKPLSFIVPILSFLGIKDVRALRLQRFIYAISRESKYLRNALLLTMESKFSNPLRVLNKRYKNELSGIDPFYRYRQVYSQFSKNMNDAQALFYADAQIILKDTFFEKVDKAVMANSIEVRVPFIDNELTQFILSVPGEMKIKGEEPKYLLKKALHDVVPHEVLYGKKKGFGVPYALWLKTSLKEYFIQQVSTEIVSQYFDHSEIMKMFNKHLKNKGNFDFLLWKVLIFAVWLNQNNIE